MAPLGCPREVAVLDCLRAHSGQVPRTTKNPYSLNWKVMREAFYATKESALGAIEGKRYVKGTKTLPIEPLTVKEVRRALEGRPARRRPELMPVEYPYGGPVGSKGWGPNSPPGASHF